MPADSEAGPTTAGWRDDGPGVVVRAARALSVAAVVGVSIAMLVLAVRGATLADFDAYWQAATRLRVGAALYPAHVDPGASDVYRYAPWFAALWIPFTFMPRPLVEVAWAAVLVSASLLVVVLFARRKSPASRLAALLFGSLLVWTAARGNVQPLLVLLLVAGLPRRTAPVWIALAASMKLVPILYVLVFLRDRRIGAALATLLLTAILVVPMPIVGWTAVDPGPSLSLYYLVSPAVWAGAAALSIGVAAWLGWRRSPVAPAVIGMAIVAALPRLLLYDLTFLAPVALGTDGDGSGDSDVARLTGENSSRPKALATPGRADRDAATGRLERRVRSSPRFHALLSHSRRPTDVGPLPAGRRSDGQSDTV